MFDYSTFAPEVAAPTPAPEPLAQAVTGRALVTLIGRIEEAIEAETAALGSDPDFDIKASNARKGRYLYELNKAMKARGPGDLGPEHRDGIFRLRQKLVANEAAILAHLDAVREVADLIKGAIERAEADGTYSDRGFGSISL